MKTMTIGQKLEIIWTNKKIDKKRNNLHNNNLKNDEFS